MIMSEEVIEQMIIPVNVEPTVDPVVDPAVEPVLDPKVPDVEVTEQIRNPEGYEKALKIERESRKDLERKLREFESAEQDRVKAAMTDQERAILEAKESARAEVTSEFEVKVLRARVEAKAAGMNFHDPDLIVSLLGDVPADATDDDLVAALEQIGKDRPYLVKTAIPKMDMGPRTGADQQSLGSNSGEDWFRNLINKAR